MPINKKRAIIERVNSDDVTTTCRWPHLPIDTHPFPRFGAYNQRARPDLKSQTFSSQRVRGIPLLALSSQLYVHLSLLPSLRHSHRRAPPVFFPWRQVSPSSSCNRVGVVVLRSSNARRSQSLPTVPLIQSCSMMCSSDQHGHFL